MIAIAAVSKNNVIGLDGKIPWKCKEDLQFFKKTTMDRDILMGRKTYEGMKDTPLEGRRLWVLSRTKGIILNGEWPYQGIENFVPNTLHPNFVICGGAEIYKQFLPDCESLYLTEIDQEVEGDTYFPPYKHLFKQWEVIQSGEGYRIYHYFNV